MQTMDMGSAEAALAQMSAVPAASSASYFLQLDPSGQVDILDSPLVLAKPDVGNETVYEIQLDPFMVDERNLELVNLPNFTNSVTFQPEFYDEHNNLITAQFNAPQIQYHIDDMNFSQMLMNNTFTAILPAPPQIVYATESQEMTEVASVPEATSEIEVCVEVERQPVIHPTPNCNNNTASNTMEDQNQRVLVSNNQAPTEKVPQVSSQEDNKMETDETEEGQKMKTFSSPQPEKDDQKEEDKETKPPAVRKFKCPEKLWNFTEDPVMPPVKEIFPSVQTPADATEEQVPFLTEEDLEEADGDKFESEFLYEGIDPDDELYISYLKRPDETKTAMCILCYKWFNDSSDLDNHLKSVHQDNMILYGCKRCGKQFWSRFLRQRHEKMHRYDLKGPIQRYTPKNRPFDHYESRHYLKRLRPAPFTKDYVEHIKRIHSEIKATDYECFQCGKTFPTEEGYREHYDENHALQTCIHCREIFDNAKLLRKHEQDDHGEYHVKKNYPGGAWKMWESSWDCDELKKKDDKVVSLYLYHNYSKRAADENVKTCTDDADDDSFYTNVCEEVSLFEYNKAKKIASKKKLAAEKSQSLSKSGASSSSPGESPKAKKSDSKSAPARDDDDQHIKYCDNTKTTQSSSKNKCLPYKCDPCKTSFDNEPDLQRHIKTHSIRAMAYMCQYCGRGFATHSNRKEHERIHTGDKPYVCPICSRAFVQISNLKKHIQTHKDKNNLQCSTCNKQFVKESSLILHQRAHSQDRKFRCHICDRAYNYASLLKRHMRIHTGENPYSCDDCGMQFHELVSLHYHRKKVHTGERPHRCDECGRAFILSSDLKKHLKIHTRNGNSIKTTSTAAKSGSSKNSPASSSGNGTSAIPEEAEAYVENNVGGSISLTGANHLDQYQSNDASPQSEESGVDFVPDGEGQSISDGNQVLVISEADLLKTTLTEKDDVINNETKENSVVVLSTENHV